MTYDDRMISRTLVLGGFRDFCDVFALTFKACIKALVLDEGARCIMLCIGKRVHRYFSKVSNVPHFWWPWLMVCSQQQVGAGHTHLSTRGIPLNSSHWKWDPSLWLAQCRHIRDSNSKVLTRPVPPDMEFVKNFTQPSHGIRICIKRKKIIYGKFFDFCAEKCVYN